MNATELKELAHRYRDMSHAELLDCVRDLIEIAREQSADTELNVENPMWSLACFADRVVGHDALTAARDKFRPNSKFKRQNTRKRNRERIERAGLKYEPQRVDDVSTGKRRYFNTNEEADKYLCRVITKAQKEGAQVYDRFYVWCDGECMSVDPARFVIV